MAKCKLCLDKEADFKGSHIVPHFLLKRIFNIEGKKGRDYELEFVIDGINTQAYYGRKVPREKLDSLFDEVKEGVTEENKDPHVEDYIFCTSCEKRLGAIESEYAKTLDKHSNTTYNSGIKSELGLLFWASVLWRMSVNKKNGVSQTKGEDETLRRILNRCIKENIEDIDIENMRSSKDLRKISYKLLRCPGFSNSTPTHLFMYPVIINPYTILIDEFILFFSHNSNYNDYKVRDFYGIKSEVIDAPLNNNTNNEQVLVFSNDTMNGVFEGLKKQMTQIRFNYMLNYLDLLHVELGGKGKMDNALKKEIFDELNNSEAKEGEKFTHDHFNKTILSIMSKYKHIYHSL
jgi:hypothetical protein